MKPGIVKHKDGFFILDLRPDVRIYAKRLLPRVKKNSKLLKIKSTPSYAADIELLVNRWDLDVESGARLILSEAVACDREHRRFIQSALAGEIASREEKVPMALPPRQYQEIAANLAIAQQGLLCADELGLGKTITGITLISRSGKLPVLVVCPTHLVHQWADEIRRFAPSLSVVTPKKGTPYTIPKWDVMVLNYHKLAGWMDVLIGTPTLIFDEAQELRRTESNKYQSAHTLARSAELRLGLTATPVYNYGGEIHAIMDVLLPDRLGDFDEFCREWDLYGFEKRKMKFRDPKVFHAYMISQGMMIRRSRKDVGRELPSCLTITHTIDTDSKALKDVSGRAGELARFLLSEEKHRGIDRAQSAAELDNLIRQATGIAKAPHVATFVRMLVESGESVLLFGWHHAVYDIWEEELKDLNPAFYTGSESPIQKQKAKNRFIDGSTNLFIGSLRSGAGLDGLQKRAKVVVFGELDWSPAVHSQCIGRLHRDGQQDEVTVYYLLAEDGADPIMADVLGIKKGQQLGLLGIGTDDKEQPQRALDASDRIKRLAERYIKNKTIHKIPFTANDSKSVHESKLEEEPVLETLFEM